MEQLSFAAAQRLALPAWGGSVDAPSKRDSAKAGKMPKNAGPTPSRVHAVLGTARNNQLDLAVLVTDQRHLPDVFGIP